MKGSRWKKRIMVMLIGFLCIMCGFGLEFVGNASGTTGIGALKSLQRSGNAFVIEAEDGKLAVELCTASSLRIRYTQQDFLTHENDYAYDAVIATQEWQAVDCTYTEQSDYYKISTSKMTVRIYKNPVSVAVYDANNANVIMANAADPIQWNGQSKQVNFTLDASGEEEHIYGLGIQGSVLDWRGNQFTSWLNASNLHTLNPLFLSTNGYGLFMNNAYKSVYDFRGDTEYSVTVDGGEVDYYVFLGDMQKIQGDFSTLTGKSSLTPLYSLGITYRGKSTWNTETMLETIETFQEKGLPMDVLGLEPGWQTETYPCSYVWNTNNFPDPEEFIDTVHALGVKLNLWTHPYISENSPIYDEILSYSGVQNDNWSIIPDFNLTDAREIFWNWYKENIVALGADGFKVDETDQYVYADTVFPSGMTGSQYHNLLGLLTTNLIQEGYKNDFNTRTFTYSRGNFTGTQRYPNVAYTDEYNLSDYLVTVVNSGFTGAYFVPELRGDNEPDDIMYQRRVQLMAFTPYAQINEFSGGNVPWERGEEAQATYQKYTQLHENLIPYVYSQMYLQSQNGVGLIRPLVMVYSEDANTYNISDQYMYGDSFLVAPVTSADYVSTRNVYLPQGLWYDYETGYKYEGGQTIEKQTTPDMMPLYVKAGSIIPTWDNVKNVEEGLRADKLRFDVFPVAAGSSSFTLYEDDGISFDYESGVYAKRVIAQQKTDTGFTVSLSAPQGSYTTPQRTFLFQVRYNACPSAVSADGAALTQYSAEELSGKTQGWSFADGIITIQVADTKAACLLEITVGQEAEQGEEPTLSLDKIRTEYLAENAEADLENGAFAAGSSLTFHDITVQNPATYPVTVVYENAGEASELKLTINDGEDIRLMFPATEDTAEVTFNLPMRALQNTLCFHAESANQLELTGIYVYKGKKTEYTPQGTAFEAEAGQLNGTNTLSSAYASGNAMVGGFTEDSDVVVQNIYAATDLNAVVMAVRYSNVSSQDCTLHYSINDSASASVSLEPTGSRDLFGYAQIIVYLPQGDNSIRFSTDGEQPIYIDAIYIENARHTNIDGITYEEFTPFDPDGSLANDSALGYLYAQSDSRQFQEGRYVKDNGWFIYKFDVADNAQQLLMTLNVANHYNIEVTNQKPAADGTGDFEKVAMLTSDTDFNTNRVDLLLDLSKWLEDNEENVIYVKFSDAIPEGTTDHDGFFLFDVTVQTRNATELASLEGERIEMDSCFGTAEEKYLVEQIRTKNYEGDKRYIDGAEVSNDGYMTYRFDLEDSMTRAKLTLDVAHALKLQISTDNQNWTTVAQNSNVGTYSCVCDLGTFLTQSQDNVVYVRLSDNDPSAESNGVFLFSVAVEPINEKYADSTSFDMAVSSEVEKELLFADSGSNIYQGDNGDSRYIEAHSPAGSYFTYRVDFADSLGGALAIVDFSHNLRVETSADNLNWDVVYARAGYGDKTATLNISDALDEDTGNVVYIRISDQGKYEQTDNFYGTFLRGIEFVGLKGEKMEGAVTVWNETGYYGDGTPDKAFDDSTDTFIDGQSDCSVGLTLDAPKTLTQLLFYPREGWASRMQGGVIQGSNEKDAGFVDLYTVDYLPEYKMYCVDVDSVVPYQYYRYVSPAGGFCNIAYLEFRYDPEAPAYTEMPTDNVVTWGNVETWNGASTYPVNAFDGNTGSFVDATTDISFGVDLGEGSEKALTAVTFYPRGDFPARMNGGKIQGSNSMDGPFEDLFVIDFEVSAQWYTFEIDNDTAYRYYRYVSPAGGFCNISELNLYYNKCAPVQKEMKTDSIVTWGNVETWDGASTYPENAFDGDTGTFVDTKTDISFGIDLGAGGEKTLTAVTFYPRADFPARMNGGKIQGSDSMDGPFEDLFVIDFEVSAQEYTFKIENDRAYRYYRYVSPAGGYCNIAELSLFYTEGGHSLTYHDGKNASCTEPGWYAYETCENCNYTTYAQIPAKGHSYSTAWSKDSTQHWKECACGDKIHIGEHGYDNACDATCNTCGHTRNTTHAWETTYSYNATQHWKECTVCHEKDAAVHTGGNADCQNKAVCEDCLQPYGQLAQCDVTEEKVEDRYLVSAANCKAAAVYYKSCSACGKAGTETFLHGAPDDQNHVDGTEVRDAATATCTADGYTGDTYCKGCGVKLAAGTVIPGGHKLDLIPGKAATHDAPGNIGYYTCSLCQKLYANDKGTTELRLAEVIIAQGEHAYTMEHDANGHWKGCDCGSKTEEGTHTYGQWVITKKAEAGIEGSKERTCSLCGYRQTEKIPAATTPTTGDDMPLGVLLVTLLVSACGVVTMVLLIPRKKGKYQR